MDSVVNLHAMNVFWSHLRALRLELDQPGVQELMVNSPTNIWIEKAGEGMRKLDLAVPAENIMAAVMALRTSNGKAASPIMDARCPGLRLAIALSPVAVNGHSMCIRKHSELRFKMEDYLSQGSFDILTKDEQNDRDKDSGRPEFEYVSRGGQGVADMLRWMMKSHQSILIAGATGSGKTSLMDMLLGEISAEDRVLTIEDTSELKVEVPNSVSFEISEKDDVKVWNLVKLALRYRPDRVILGEIRGAEAYDLLDVLNTGHAGGMCTLHANSAVDALLRIENLVRKSPDAANLPLHAMRASIASAFRFAIFASKKGGKRGPEEIIELLGVDDRGNYLTKTIFSKTRDVTGDITPTGERRKGIV